jgi:hypothetical protein
MRRILSGLFRVCALVVPVTFLFVASCTGGGDDGVGAPASSTTTTAAVGPTGGEVQGPGVALSIPSGALTSDQQIRITRTEEAPPSTHKASSAIFRFEPDGLSFAIPARVTFPLSGSVATPTIFWSSTDGTSFDAIPTEVVGSNVAASVSHFSRGFVGEKLGPTIGDPPEDAGSIDSASDDATVVTDATADSSNACGGCNSGLFCCGNICRDTNTDSFNCGACNKVCDAGTCVNGTCTCGSNGTACDAGSKCCTGVCNLGMCAPSGG